MKYMGSKARIAKYILPIILKDRKEGQWYVEPFCGGCNTLDKVTGNRVGCDSNLNVINSMIAIRDCVCDLPKDNKQFTEEDYKELRTSNYKYKSYAGFAFSYSGKWLGGWCRDGLDSRDYVAESYRNALNQSPLLQGVQLVHKSYLDLEFKQNYIIYCDPPYEGSTGYKDKFNHAEFWDWCRRMKAEGHTIFISEYSAPEDFICVWQKEQVSSLTKDTGSKRAIEKLFTI
jgi:DNA adenine methylase